MNAFIYQADLYCENCIDKIKATLQKPANVEDESTFDSDDYPKGPELNGGGEADCPQNCRDCGIFLENSLTDVGVKYVCDALQEYIDGDRGTPDVLDAWADDLRNNSLEDDQDVILDHYETLRAREKELA